MGSSVVRYAALIMRAIKIAITILPLSPSLPAPCQQGITGLSLSRHPGYELASGKAPRCAINHYGSFSGDYALHDWWSEQRRAPLDNVQVTGAHRASLFAVAKGEADIAAIDEISFHLAAHAFPEMAEALTIIDYTQARPGLPFLCAAPYGAQKETLSETTFWHSPKPTLLPRYQSCSAYHRWM